MVQGVFMAVRSSMGFFTVADLSFFCENYLERAPDLTWNAQSKAVLIFPLQSNPILVHIVDPSNGSR